MSLAPTNFVLLPPKRPVQLRALVAAGMLLLFVILQSWYLSGFRNAGAAIIGAFAGFALYHASFGFTSAWRRIVTERRGTGLRYQFLLIISVSTVSFPLLAYGAEWGLPTGGFIMPMGVGLAVGAFMFGFGMQFAGGCGSGTLFVTGGGSTRMVVTLSAFVVGSFMGTWHLGWWNGLPRLPAWSMVKNLGPGTAWLVLASGLGAIALLTIIIERRTHGSLEKRRTTESFLKGKWSLLAGAMGLTLVCVSTFIVVGRPWGVTWGFALWGAKVAQALGMDVAAIPFWENSSALTNSIFMDTTSVMNFAIIAGAFAAAALAANFRPVWKLSAMEIVTAILGGLLMGYGARLSYGCNIGAYVGGLTSGSLHGWLWGALAFVGSSLAVMFRRRAGI